MVLNQQNFDGRVFATTPQQINYNLQGVNPVNIQRVNIPPQHYIMHQAYPIQVSAAPPPTVTNIPANNPPHSIPVNNPPPIPLNNPPLPSIPIQNLTIQHPQALTVFQQK